MAEGRNPRKLREQTLFCGLSRRTLVDLNTGTTNHLNFLGIVFFRAAEVSAAFSFMGTHRLLTD